MQRRDFLRLVACATGTAVLGGTLSSRDAKAAAAKPQKLNLLYATAEADSEAIKLVLPDFASKLGYQAQSGNLSLCRASAKGLRGIGLLKCLLRHYGRRYPLDAGSDE